MQLPARFGKYELLERIATGGMAEVYLARSFGLAGFEKRLVIKRLRPELADDPRFVQMFINEAKIGVHLNHPNVVQVYELGRVANTHYIAMELLAGRDLTRLVKVLRADDLGVPQPLAVEIVAESCRGLAYAHARTDASGELLGLVHRDVSPHNILVTSDGEVKLVDFGIARLINTTAAQSNSKPGPGGGKYAYMSPEQARGDDVDHRSDIFSMGIVLWELVVRRRLFKSPDHEEKLRRVTHAVIPDPRTLGVEIDDALWEIMQRALAHDPAGRYASAALFEEDLRAWLFERRHRVGRLELAQLVREAFPDLAERNRSTLEIEQLAADVDRLDPADRTDETGRTPTGSGALPGRLRAPAGERRPVVVVIVDVDGLTELSATVEPATLVKRKYQLLRWTRRLLDRHGGIIQSAVDDHITLLFGAQRTRLDEVDHALECALALHRDVSALRRKGMGLDLAIGVHLGEVTVSQVGKRVRYVARGDTTRLARRLSAIADHGQVLASEQVLDAAQGRFVLRWGPPVPSRGGKASLPSYVVERRAHGLHGRHQGKWLRRGRELEVLREALGEIAGGHGSAVALTGAVGCGKSRFIREFHDLARRRQLPFFGTRSSAVAGERPLEAVRDLLCTILGADPESPVSELVASTGRLTQLGLSPRDLDAISVLFGAELPHPPERSEVWGALSRTLRGLSRERPVMVAFDDVHHDGRSFQAELGHLITGLRAVPVLFLVASEGPLPESLRSACVGVSFDPFPPELQARFVESVLGVGTLQQGVLPLLERTCEGNPLYLEEMLKFLVGRRQIEVVDGVASLVSTDEPALPHSLQALISARIDALDPAARGLLQLAAVAGARFTEAVLAEAAGLDDPTPLILDLVGQGLVVRDSDDEFAFASELVRAAALRGTLGVQRSDYHRLVAAAIETVHADTLEPWHEALVDHCAQGGRLVDAARYAFKAGEELERNQYLERAQKVYKTGLEHLARVSPDPDHWDARVQGEALLHLRHGLVGMLLGDDNEGRNHLAVALDIASENALPWIETRAHVALGRSYLQSARTDMAKAHLGQARAQLRSEPDPEVEREAVEASAMLAFEEGRNADAELLWQQAMALAEGDSAAMARCQIGLANRFLRSGAHDRAGELLFEAVQTSRAAGDRILEGRVLNNVGLVHSWAGRHEEALASYRAALELRQGIGYTRGVVINHHNIGDVHFQNGDRAKAWVAFHRSRELATEIGWTRGVSLNDVYLAYLHVTAGHGDITALSDAIEHARQLGDNEILTSGLWLAGRHLLEIGQPGAARVHLEEALETARQFGMQPMVEIISDLLNEGQEAVSPMG